MEDVPANKFKIDLVLAARAALRKVQQEIAMEEVEQRLRSELQFTELREKLDTLEKTMKTEENELLKSRGSKLNAISGKTSGRTREGSKIMSVMSVAGQQVMKILAWLTCISTQITCGKNILKLSPEP